MAISVCSGRAWRLDPVNTHLPFDPENILASTSHLTRREVGRLAGSGADLDDLHQEARLAVLAAAAYFEAGHQATFETFATGVVRRHLISCLRSIRKQRFTVPLDEELENDGTDDRTINPERLRSSSNRIGVSATGVYDVDSEFQVAVIHSAVRELAPRQREAIQLRFWENLKLQEIAQKLGVSTARAGKLVEKGLETLRRALEPYREDSCCS
jgi:RNA polymerase sigma factor (sigma-70 family)